MAAPAYQPPPPGPGVAPPFVAPPTDGSRQRRWIAIAVGLGAALLCAVGGVFGLGGLVVLGTQAVIDQSRTVVIDYLSAVRDQRYHDAYRLLCDTKQATTTPRRFEASLRASPRVSSFTVDDPNLASEPIRVPATLRYANGTAETIDYLLEQDRSTGEFEVCGEAD